MGACPPREQIAALIDQVRDRVPRELCTDELASVDPSWRGVAESAAGAVVVPVDSRGDRWLAWFRPETRASIRWGGDPSAKEIAIDVTGPRLDPRASFEEYLEEVEGRSVPWTDAQLSVARTLAHRVSELYAGRTRHNAEVAAVIQRTVLLETFPEIAGIEGAARYVPSAGDPIGGDWYDVFFRAEGGPILALGDVAGHGVEAAATMAQLRNALRAYVIREESPAEAMSRLNELMMTLLPDEMATVLLVELDPVGRTSNIVNAGHYPPLVVGREGARLLEGGTNLALGVSRDMHYTSARVDLPVGSTLVAYTDGLIERRNRSLDDSFAALVDAAAGPEGEPVGDLCDRLLAVVTDADVEVADDITVVAIRFTGD